MPSPLEAGSGYVLGDNDFDPLADLRRLPARTGSVVVPLMPWLRFMARRLYVSDEALVMV